MNADELKKYPSEVVFRVAQLFVGEKQEGDWDAELTIKSPADLEKHFADNVADKVNREFSLNRKLSLTRERVYPLAREAARRGFLLLVPPLEEQLKTDLARIFPHVADHLHVVRTMGPHDNAKIAAYAARLAVGHAQRLGRQVGNRGAIGLGLGPGRATRDFCKHFSHLISIEKDVPYLDLFAISAAGPAKEPQYACTSFFNMFTEAAARVRDQYGLFAEALVPATDFPRVKRMSGVKQAFAERDQVSLIVTSMGDMRDPHDLLRMFLEESGENVDRRCSEEGWVGNVQYRPFTDRGPVHEKGNDLRAVTLFELDELVRWAKRDDKHVILIARQCGKPGCNMTRARALLPLLTESNNDTLRAFSTLIMDSATCNELLRISAGKKSGSS